MGACQKPRPVSPHISRRCTPSWLSTFPNSTGKLTEPRGIFTEKGITLHTLGNKLRSDKSLAGLRVVLSIWNRERSPNSRACTCHAFRHRRTPLYHWPDSPPS